MGNSLLEPNSWKQMAFQQWKKKIPYGVLNNLLGEQRVEAQSMTANGGEMAFQNLKKRILYEANPVIFWNHIHSGCKGLIWVLYELKKYLGLY